MSSVSEAGGAEPACSIADHVGRGYNAAGNVLYTYYLQSMFCGVGSGVVSASITAVAGESHWPGWSYRGVSESGATARDGVGHTFARYDFAYGPVAGGVVAEQTPCLNITAIMAEPGRFIHHLTESCGLVP